MSNIGMTRDEPGIRKSRWPSPPGAANNSKNYLNDLKSYKSFFEFSGGACDFCSSVGVPAPDHLPKKLREFPQGSRGKNRGLPDLAGKQQLWMPNAGLPWDPDEALAMPHDRSAK